MILECPHCFKKMNLSVDRFRGQKISLKCPGCHQPFQRDIPPELGSKVMIAHEDERVCQRVQTALSESFAQVETVHDCQAALHRIGLDAPDLLLLDVTLPGMLSFELIDRIRSKEETSRCRIILLTSPYKIEPYRSEPESLYGADGYVELSNLSQLIPLLQEMINETCVVPNPEDILPDDQRIKQRILEEVERVESAHDKETVEAINNLARLIVANIGKAQQQCIDDPWHDLECMERVVLELDIGRQVLSQLAPAVRSHKTDYIKEAFGEYVRQHRLERAGAYYPGVDH